MLHTDAHAENIPKHRKLKKQDFVQNTIRVCKKHPSVTEDFLEKMYDRIVKEKFELKADCMK